MSDERNPLELALDLLVFAPVGVIVAVTEELPALVEKGRARVQSQLGTARAVGQLAAPHLQGEAEKAVKGLFDRLLPSVLPGLGGEAFREGAGLGQVAPGDAEPPGPPAAPPADRGPQAAVPAGIERPGETPPVVGSGHPRRVQPAQVRMEPAADLAIPAYDTLSAMQVVQRLSGLSAVELGAVRDYEEAHRGRKTIINRADQLLSEAG